MIRLWRRSFVVVTRMVHYKVFGSRVGDMQRGGPTDENERSLELWMWICAVGLLPPEGAVVWVCEMRGGARREDLGKSTYNNRSEEWRPLDRWKMVNVIDWRGDFAGAPTTTGVSD